MTNPYINSRFFSRLERQAIRFGVQLTGFFGGKHRTNKYGQTVEFADYRAYMLGDDLRRIDWNLYSRFRKFFIKLFNDERQMDVQIYLDCSASMGLIEKKAQYAVGLCAGLGYLAVRNTDKLTYKCIEGKKLSVKEGTIVGTNRFFRSVRTLEETVFQGESFISAAVLSDAGCGGKNGLSVIVSDFLTDNDWKKAVDYLRYKGREVVLIQVLAAEEIAPSYLGHIHLIDSEAEILEDGRNMRMRINGGQYAAYEKACKAIQETIKNYCLSRGAKFVSLATDQPIEKAVFKQLSEAGVTE